MRIIHIDENTYLSFLSLTSYSFKTYKEQETCYFNVIADSFILCRMITRDGIADSTAHWIMMPGDVPKVFTAGIRAEILGAAAKKTREAEKTTAQNRPPEARKINDYKYKQKT